MALEADIAKLAIAGTLSSIPDAPTASTAAVEQQDPSNSEQPRPQTEAEEEELIDPSTLPSSLDRLLFSYCELLDQYQAIQGRLSSLLTEGYLNLAKANYESRARFGKDYYHGSMTASKIMSLDEKELTPLHAPDTSIEYTHLSFVEVPLPPTEDAEEVQVADKVDASATTTSTATEIGPVRRRKPGDEKPSDPEEDKKPTEDQQLQQDGDEKPPAPKVRKTKIPLNRDPIRWFGVLVPFSLRKSQGNFTDAVSEVANLLSVVNQLRALEAKIDDLRAEKA
ncbi:hypothetical protein POJ06DRAFT_300685 [Lipomyces tetrasporus]|uniref:Vacuolar ATPase assembly protein VMA22 n=1 Tax=Lipomyces tetrasporus TaxID=54092 RepID=A0AAD7VTU3_9ASCO|nr:uncharacterized protein POJ06DRAFT_300685 [Lipomyces tetrasporus]KAJ8101351.1 hypothetical protein POJ06DRAFT_300685 [Lipomyces tetrasporus]